MRGEVVFCYRQLRQWSKVGFKWKRNPGKTGNSRVLLYKHHSTGTISRTDQLCVQGTKGWGGSSLCSSDDKLVQKLLFQAAVLLSNLLLISSLTVPMASLDSFNLNQHLDSFVSLLCVWHLQTSIRSSFCFQFASLNRLSSPLFFLFAKDTAITSPAWKTFPAPTADCLQYFWTWQTALTQRPWISPKFLRSTLHSPGTHSLFSHPHCKFSKQSIAKAIAMSGKTHIWPQTEYINTRHSWYFKKAITSWNNTKLKFLWLLVTTVSFKFHFCYTAQLLCEPCELCIK